MLRLNAGQLENGDVEMTTNSNGEEVTFDFVRSPFFRVVHSNGVWGGITPRQELSMTFYSERQALPQYVTHRVTSEGLGPEINREGTSNIQREWEVEVLMSMEEAVSLHRWLGAKIDEWREIGLRIPKDNTPEVS